MRIASFTAAALAVAVTLAVLASPFASPSPDGFEKVAEEGDHWTMLVNL